MKYRGALLYFAAVAAIAVIAWALSPTSPARDRLTVIAAVAFAAGIIGFEIRAGWTNQRTKGKSPTTLLVSIVCGGIGAAVVYTTLIVTKPTSSVTLPLGLCGMLCLLLVFRTVGALIASHMKKRETSEQTVAPYH